MGYSTLYLPDHFGGQVGPVAAGQQLGRAGPGLAPGGGMPAGPVKSRGQNQVAGWRGGAQDMLPSLESSYS